MKNVLPYIALVIMVVIILIQNQGCFDPKNTLAQDTIVKYDTLIVYKYITDTVPGKPVYIKTKVDTSVWIKRDELKPDTTYFGLLSQYKKLGNNHFSTNFFKTEFPIADYGTITVSDSIRENKLIHSELITNLNIPTTTITVEKEIPQVPKRQLFVGTTLTGNQINPISGVYGGLQLKTKNDRLYGLSIGYNGTIQYGGSFYFPIKIK
jgi:hypothetical protein